MKKLFWVLLLLAGLYRPHLFAQTMYNREFRVNTTKIGNQWGASATKLEESKFVIAWASADYTNKNYSIFAQIFDTSGNKMGTEIKVNIGVISQPKGPKVLNMNNNRFVIGWEDNSVFLQIFDYNGEKVGPQYRVSYLKSDFDFNIKLLNLDNNNFAICWEYYSLNNNLKAQDVYLQLFDVEGNRKGGNILVNSYTNDWQFEPQLLLLPNSNFIVCWTGANSNEGSFGIFVQKFDINGNKIDNEIQGQ